MGLGYLTLSIKSEQDKYLTGNPQFTFFKSVYKKHTNFATDFQFVNLIGDSSNTLGKKVYIEIPKNGDLLHRAYLVIDVIGSNNLINVDPLAYSLIDYIDLFIGGQRVDRHYGSWLQLYHELYESSEKQNALSDMISLQSSQSNTNKLFIPLKFWFNNNIGLALPLLALQYNDIKIEIKFKTKDEVNSYLEYSDSNNLVRISDNSFQITHLELLSEFIHLDNNERRLFMSNSHEYLITQIQTSLSNPINLYKNDSKESFEKIQHKTDLRFNHPVKELIWTIQDSNALVINNNGDVFNYSNKGILSSNHWNGFMTGKDQLIAAQLVLNGKDMTEELPASFYRNIQHFQYHKGCRLKSIRDYNSRQNKINDIYTDYSRGTGAYSYSFCLSPEEFQPSGSLNFSNLEMAQIKYRLERFKNNVIDVLGKIQIEQSLDNININSITFKLNQLKSGDDSVLIGKIVLVEAVGENSDNNDNGLYEIISVDENENENTNLHIKRLENYVTNEDFLNNTPVYIKTKDTEFVLSFNASTNDKIITDLTDKNFSLDHKTLTIYAINYNIFRITSGMGSILFTS